jgi:hypothetical protein
MKMIFEHVVKIAVCDIDEDGRLVLVAFVPGN